MKENGCFVKWILTIYFCDYLIYWSHNGTSIRDPGFLILPQEHQKPQHLKSTKRSAGLTFSNTVIKCSILHLIYTQIYRSMNWNLNFYLSRFVLTNPFYLHTIESKYNFAYRKISQIINMKEKMKASFTIANVTWKEIRVDNNSRTRRVYHLIVFSNNSISALLTDWCSIVFLHELKYKFTSKR